MTLTEPLGLLLILFVPLVFLVIRLSQRQRRVSASSYFILQALVETLPLLSSTFLLRRRLQMLCLMSAVLSFSLSAAGLTVGNSGSPSLTSVLLLDHLSDWRDPEGRARGWEGVLSRAGDTIREFRRDDRIVITLPDRGVVSRGALSPRRAAALLQKLEPTHLPLDAARAGAMVNLAAENFQAETVHVISPSPPRWAFLGAGTGRAAQIIKAPSPPDGRNFGILNVDILPDLLHPEEVSLYCRVGYFEGSGEGRPVRLVLSVQNNGSETGRKVFTLDPGATEGVVMAPLKIEPGLLTLRLSPGDNFPQDNIFRHIVRARPFLPADLVSPPGNPALEAALEALPGLSLAVRGNNTPAAEPVPSIVIYDRTVPALDEGSSLVISPTAAFPGFPLRSEVSNLKLIEARSSHNVLTGVRFDNLHIERLPVLEPPQSVETIANADGYPILMLGRTSGGMRVGIVAFDPVESQWIYEPSFPILVANLMSWLSREGPGSRSSLIVGEQLPENVVMRAEKITDPAGHVLEPSPSAGHNAFTVTRAGRYRVATKEAGASGDLFVNLVNAGVSRDMALTSEGSSDPLPEPFFPRPFKLELSPFLLWAGIVLLAAERFVAPRSEIGRYS